MPLYFALYYSTDNVQRATLIALDRPWLALAPCCCAGRCGTLRCAAAADARTPKSEIKSLSIMYT